MSLVKVYSVKFIQYTNCSNDTISSNNKENTKYIKVNERGFENVPFLIKENDIDKYKDFGGGIKELIFAGYMEDSSLDNVVVDESKYTSNDQDSFDNDEKVKYTYV